MKGTDMRRIARLVAGLVVAGTAVAVPAVAGPPAGAAVNVTVTPSTDLLDFHPVEVTATGLVPGATYVLTQCQGDECAGPGDGFLPANVAVLDADGTGALSETIAVSRSTCPTGPCTVRVLSLEPEIATVGETPITLAPTGRYQHPEATLEVSYPGPLRDGGPVTVDGEGYHRWFRISRTFPAMALTEVCRAVDGEPDLEDDCVEGFSDVDGQLRLDYATVTHDGTASGTVRPLRYLDLPDGTWDCRLQGCTIALSQGRNPVSERVPLEWGPEWAGWTDAVAFVSDLYARISSAAPSGGAVDALAAALQEGSTTGPEVVREVAGQTQGQAVAEVTRQYVALLGRRPDTAGLRFWATRLQQGRPVSWMADAFGASAEFRAQYGGLTAAQIVDRAYQRLLYRPGDAAGRAHWIGRLQRGESPARVVLLMARSAEFRARQADHAVIEAITFGLLDRAATAMEWGAEPVVVARRALAAISPPA